MLSLKRRITFLVISAVSLTKFICLADDCPAIPPCTCSGTAIFCSNQNLTSFPVFNQANISRYYISIYVDTNLLTNAPERAFENLTLSNNTNLELYLEQNKLSDISEGAFDKVIDRITYIQLDDNDFNHIPVELTKLARLNTLLFRNNPIVSLDYSTIKKIGQHINQLYLGMQGFKKWPNEFEQFRNLTDLNIQKLKLTVLKANVFDGFASTLKSLSLYNTSLSQLTPSICSLKKLVSFTIIFDFNIENGNLSFNSCSRNISSVNSVLISRTNLRFMPDIFNLFPSLTSLYITYSELGDIPVDYIPKGSPLRMLSLTNNKFTTVPKSISKLTHLEQLEFQYNNLKTIKDDDFSALSNISTLSLSNNPIVYIAPNSFRNNVNLVVLILHSTEIHKLPLSVLDLPKLQYLFLEGDPIECNCSIKYLKDWDVSNVNIVGTCDASSTSIKQFLLEYLPKCPLLTES